MYTRVNYVLLHLFYEELSWFILSPPGISTYIDYGITAHIVNSES